MFMLSLILTSALFTASLAEVFEAGIGVPVVINTWKFENATKKAWEVLFVNKGSAVDAVEAGCSACELEQCDFTVGYGGSPDESGETTLDAMIMNGSDMNVGAVGGLRRIKNAVGVARRVLENTEHSFLVGELATKFAVEMGFSEVNLTTDYSRNLYEKWREGRCQPNFRTQVHPDPKSNCGPYRPLVQASPEKERKCRGFGEKNHDTIGMVAIDRNFHVATCTSTNGARHKIPGRVGDSPIAGAGSYADDRIGGAVATGDGDIMMRFLPSFVAVQEMLMGRSPTRAARIAIHLIKARYPYYKGAVIALRNDGVFGAACNGMPKFPFASINQASGEVKIFHVQCK